MNIIDISHHNGKINWLTVATKNNPKIEGVIFKTSTGVGSQDPRVLYNAFEAKKNGFKIGYYHYASLNNENEIEDATAEANWLISVLKKLPKADLPIALDLEDPKKLLSLDPMEILTWTKTFFSILEKNNIKNYAFYSYAPYINDNLPKNHDLGNIPLWIAQYRNTLTLPNGWKKQWLWQYTDKGSVKGINGNVDLNK